MEFHTSSSLLVQIILYGLVLLTGSKILEFHLSSTSWSEANRICTENFATLMVDDFATLAAVLNTSWLGDEKSAWTGLYWAEGQQTDYLSDINCRPSEPHDGVWESPVTAASGISQRCVRVNFTVDALLQIDNCSNPLPFVCESDGYLKPDTFTRFYFAEYVLSSTDVRTCKQDSLNNIDLPCRSMIFDTSSNECLYMVNKFTAPGSSLYYNWLTSTTFYRRYIYTGTFASETSVQVFINSDVDANTIIDGTTSSSCQLQCAWSNKLCVCGDFQWGKCRMFADGQNCLPSLLISSTDGNATIYNRSTVDYPAVFLNTDTHLIPGTSENPTNCTRVEETTIIPSPQTDSFWAAGESSVDAISTTFAAVRPMSALLEPDIMSALQVSTDEVPTACTDVPIVSTEVASFSTEVASFSTEVLTTSSIFSSSVIDNSDALEPSTGFPDQVMTSSYIGATDPLATALSDPTTFSATPTTVLATDTGKTYFISQSGQVRSTQYKCDVITPTAALSRLSAGRTIFECSYIGVFGRTMLANDTSFIDKVVEELSIDTNEISSHKRKYVSAHDSRPSARNVGILGISMLAVVFGGLLILDLTSLKRDLQRLMSNVKST